MKKILSILCAAFMLSAFAACDRTVEVTAVSAEMESNPTKVAYRVDEKIDPAGAKIKVKYSDGTEKSVTVSEDMLDLTDIDMSTLGEKTVAVKYTEDGNTVSASFKITVAGAGSYFDEDIFGTLSGYIAASPWEIRTTKTLLMSEKGVEAAWLSFILEPNRDVTVKRIKFKLTMKQTGEKELYVQTTLNDLVAYTEKDPVLQMEGIKLVDMQKITAEENASVEITVEINKSMNAFNEENYSGIYINFYRTSPEDFESVNDIEQSDCIFVISDLLIM